jgi:tetratricopeptide (TPR) repeat protein
MSRERIIPLDRIRTDGWFERVGESISSFHTLCDVLGERFFAFALIIGARVSSLMIDRFNPDQSLVEFTVGGVDGEPSDSDGEPEERLTVAEFRQRLVNVLTTEDPPAMAISELSDDLESLQRFIGPRFLLLAPLYGYGLRELVIAGRTARLRFDEQGEEQSVGLKTFRERLRRQVREDLERGVERQGGTAIDLNRVSEAEQAASSEDWQKVMELLGSWPMPLAIYWRTPEGQMLPDQARQRISEGLGLLGTACGKLGDEAQGEEVLRLAVQYAQDGPAASGIYLRIARSFLDSGRYGEAIGPLRRAKALGVPAEEILPDLGQAMFERRRFVAALACVREAARDGIKSSDIDRLSSRIDKQLGPALRRWRQLVDGP